MERTTCATRSNINICTFDAKAARFNVAKRFFDAASVSPDAALSASTTALFPVVVCGEAQLAVNPFNVPRTKSKAYFMRSVGTSDNNMCTREAAHCPQGVAP